MYNTFKSETKWVEVILKDNLGVVINPQLESIHDIEVIIQSRFDQSVIGKFSRELKTGWTQATVSATNILCPVSDFSEATKGLVEAQVNIIVPDENMPTGYSITTQKGIILTLQEAFV